MTTCLYLTIDAGAVKIAASNHVTKVIDKMVRQSRGGRPEIIAAVVLDDLDQTRKLHRVLQRHWHDRNRGGGRYAVSTDEVIAVLDHLESERGVPYVAPGRAPGQRARHVVLQRFARGLRSRWRGTPDMFLADRAVLDELQTTGLITRHQRRKTGETEYRGTARCATIAADVAARLVPERGTPSAIEVRRPATEVIIVPDPGMARLEILHQIDQQDDADDALMPGYKPAGVNMRLLIGSFADISGLTEDQKRGAQQFRTVADQAQIGGARAIDYEVTRVDSSMVNQVAEIGASSRAQYQAARVHLGVGTVRLAVAERMILQDESARHVAIALGIGKGGRPRKRVIAIAREVATELARHFHTGTSGTRRARFDGERPSVVPGAHRSEVGA